MGKFRHFYGAYRPKKPVPGIRYVVRDDGKTVHYFFITQYCPYDYRNGHLAPYYCSRKTFVRWAGEYIDLEAELGENLRLASRTNTG